MEENTYVPPKVSWQDEEAGEGRGLFGKRNLIRDTPKKVRYSRAGDCRTEGSHVHRESGGKGKSQGKQAKAQKKKPSYIFLLIVIIYLLFTFFPELIRLIMELGSGLVNTL